MRILLGITLGLRRRRRRVCHLLLLLQLRGYEGSFIAEKVLLGGKVVAVLRLAFRAELLEEKLRLATV